MSSFKKLLTFLILILFVYAWYLLFYSKQNPQVVPLTPTQNYLTLYIQPDSGRNFIINEISSSQKEILVEVYLLSDKEIINNLINADKRGVNVEVILEEHPFGGSGLNPKTKTELENGGVEVKWSSKSFALTHEKSIVVDDKIALILSQNLTLSSFTKNREYNIVDRNKIDVDEIRNIFLSDWNGTSFTPTITNIIESPNTSRPALTSLINSAQNEIDVEIEDINDLNITNLLAEKAKTIKVNLIAPPIKTISSNKKSLNLLSLSNATIKTISTPYIHAKMILVDHKTAYVGSINLSSQSMDENRELGIIINQNDIIQNLKDTFSSDWNKAIPFTQ